jgi:uncharacterized membrane protein
MHNTNLNTPVRVALLFAVGLAMLVFMPSAEASESFTVDVSPSTQNGEPEETLTYTITVENTGDNDDSYNLTITSSNRSGWKEYILPTSLDVKDGQSETATLYVEIGDRDDAPADVTEFITFKTESITLDAGAKSKSVTAKVNQVYGNSLSINGTSTQNTDPDETVTFAIKVINDEGNGKDTIIFSQTSSGTDDWSFVFPGSVTLDKDESTEISFSATPDINALAGLKSISLFATSEDGDTATSITITVRVNKLPNLNVVKVGTSAQDVEAGKRVYYSFSVTNKGNAVDSFDLEIENGSWYDKGWEASLDSEEISSLDVDETINLTDVLVIKAPMNAGADDEVTIKVKVSSQENSSIYKTYTSRSTVLQDFEPKLKVTGGDTQSAEPDEEVSYTINITNEGNGEDDITLSLHGGNATWGTLAESSFTLAAGESDETTLRVTAPDGTLAQNGYSITIRATSEDTTTKASRAVFLNIQQVFEVSVSVSGDSTKSGDPGDSLSYTITVKNKGNGDDAVNLALEGDQADWGSIVEDVDLDAGESMMVNLTVNIDEEANFGDYSIAVNGSSDEAETDTYDTTSVTVTVNKEYKVDLLINEAQKNGDAGSSVVYDIIVKNKGTGDDTIRLSVDEWPSGWTANFNHTEVDISAGKDALVNLTVTIKEKEDNQAFYVNFTAVSIGAKDEDLDVNATASTITTVNQYYEFRMTSVLTYTKADPEQTFTVDILLDNKGTGDDTVDLEVTAPENATGWVTDITPSVEVPEGENRTVTLTVTVSEDAVKDSYYITVTGVSADEASETHDVTIQVDVSQRYEVQMLPRTQTKAAEANDILEFSITVKNKGTGEDTFDLELGGEVGISWGSLSNVSLTIPAGGSADVILTVEVPADAQPKSDGAYEILVNATSVDNATAIDSVARYIDVEKKELEVEITAESSIAQAEPGDSAYFDISVKNIGNDVDSVTLTFPTDSRKWATFVETGTDTHTLNLTVNQQKTVRVQVTLPVYANATGQDKTALESSTYQVTVKATTGDGSQSDTASLSTSIQQIYGAELTAQGASTAITYPSTETSASERQEKFSFKVKNLGNKLDTIDVEVSGSGSTFPDEWSASIHTSSSCSGTFSGSVGAGTSKTFYLCITPDQDSEPGNYTVYVEAKARNGAEEAVTSTVLVEVRDPTRSVILSADEPSLNLAPEVGDIEKNTARFKIVITNDGSHDDKFIAELDDVLGTGWTTDFYTKNTGSSGDKWSSSGEDIEYGKTDDLWFIVEVDPDEIDEGNYTMSVTVKNADEDISQSITLTLQISAPQRGLTVTVIDPDKEMSPEYKASASSTKNMVKFKVKLENSGTHPDSFIPEVESTLDDDWEVSFYQDSSKTQPWSTSQGVEIEANELDDLWIFVDVDGGADEGNYTITISVRNMEDDPSARQEFELSVEVQRSDITLTASDIQLEADGVVGNASAIKDGDTVTVLVEVTNSGIADADDVQVEIFYYPKKAPEDQDDIDNLINKGFDLDEGKNTYIYSLYKKSTNLKAGATKSLASDDWIIEGGEWYVEVRVDYDEDDTDNGEILETNENNNDARYPELLRIMPDLAISDLRVDARFAGLTSKTPNVDDQVTFTATVVNKGAADVDNARLYITADSSDESGVILQDRGTKDYVEFSIDAGATETIRFRWKAVSGEWTTFRAEVNPSCSDVSINIFDCEQQGDGAGTETDHLYDELKRYSDNIYPVGGDAFQQEGAEVKFEILPDFFIKEVNMDPLVPEVGDDVEITVVIENKGNADWKIGSQLLSVVFKDGVGGTITTQVSSDINEGDEIEVKFTWKFPDEDKDTLLLTYELDVGSGSWEIDQTDSSNDEFERNVDVIQPAIVGEIAALDIFSRELVRGTGLKVYHFVVLMFVAVLAIAVPVVISRRMRHHAPATEDDEAAPEAVVEEAAPPAKIGLAIQSAVDGKTANVKVPSNMPVERLIQNCVEKFPLPHANFAAHVNGEAVDSSLSLADAGLVDGSEIQLVSLEE